MANDTVTVKETIYVNASPEIVWDFTQDYEKRTTWDRSIIRATVLQVKPTRIVEIKAKGNLAAKFQYKLEDRPNKTSLAMIDTKSFFIRGGGGSWKYEASDKGTLWTQTNTLQLKSGLLSRLLRPAISYQLKRSTRASMRRAKRIIEVNLPGE